ncbi:23S ribosomal RNA methyltransferase Erm [Streptomyces sp. SID3343]|uniref:23S ribosomal RNA methyltransferase Erm n=1 Tax=Streptomyces sp. SID3343 TaxID=2690260 RepID=UPI00136BD2AF|nr:23S ribosomal RNA methyltransferase Erm [Streptomyces sp. SID3343]MYW00757.1 23S ribosomal RNA methyltransferase Erm [Streptomyces sp. SID3343]
MVHPTHGGRHELGQNFLVDRSVIATFEDLVARTTGPIVEIGPGDGALTLPLSRDGRPITAVEIDPKRARRLARRMPAHVEVVPVDVLRFAFPREPHVVVGNLPFHLTTAVLRRLLEAEHWHTAVLLVQWEVARRRAGVGGATMLTAAWWPWFDFALHARVPARAFRPMPSVDGGLLTMTRRGTPLIDGRRAAYQDFVRQVFTGPGRGTAEILDRTGRFARPAVRAWMRAERLAPYTLPKDLTAGQWAELWRLAAPREGGAPARAARREPRRARA